MGFRDSEAGLVSVREVNIFCPPKGCDGGRYTPGVRVSETASDLVYFAHSYLTYLSVSPIAAALPSVIIRNLYCACFLQLLLCPQLLLLYPIANTTLKK